VTRSQECRDQLQWIESNCPLDRTSIIPIKKAKEFCDVHVEISTMSTDAIQPLVKLKDDRVIERSVQTLKTIIDSGKKPTKTVVKKVIADSRRDIHNEPLIQQAKEIRERGVQMIENPLTPYQIIHEKIKTHNAYIETIRGYIDASVKQIVICKTDISEYNKLIEKTKLEIKALDKEAKDL